MPNVRLAARSINVVVVLDGGNTLDALAPLQHIEARIPFTVTAGGRTLTMDFPPRAVRRAYTALEEHGPENCVVLIRGKLGPNDTLTEAGLTAQVKPHKPAAAEPASAA